MLSPGISINVYKPLATGGAWIKDITAKVSDYQHSLKAVGGMDSASFTIAIPVSEADDWIENGIGRRIMVYSPTLTNIFEGFVNMVDIQVGGLAVRSGPLMDCANRVQASYVTIDAAAVPPILGVKDITTAVNNTASQGIYGILHDIIAFGGSTATEAATAAQVYLAENAYPKTSHDFVSTGGDLSLKVSCLGYVHYLKKYPFNSALTGLGNISAMVAAVITADPNALFTQSITTNTLQVPQYQQDNDIAWSYLQLLINMGDATFARWLGYVGEGRVFYYAPAPTNYEYMLNLYEHTSYITTMSGGRIEPFDVQPGRWVFVNSLMVGRAMPTTADPTDPRSVFIEEVRFTAPYGLEINGLPVSRFAKLVKQIYAGTAS